MQLMFEHIFYLKPELSTQGGRQWQQNQCAYFLLVFCSNYRSILRSFRDMTKG